MKKIKTIILSFLIFIFTSSLVFAAPTHFNELGFLEPQNVLFQNVSPSMAGNKDVFPYNNDTVTKVGMDVLYGVSKPLIRYLGEVPYRQTRDYDSGVAIDGFSNLPSSKEFSYPMTDGADPIRYWGDVPTKVEKKEDQMTRKDMEGQNKDSIVSLRLFALSNTASLNAISSIFYTLVTAITSILASVVSLVIQLKCLDVAAIAQALHLDKLAKLLYEAFVIQDGHVSFLLIICVISLMLAIFKWAMAFARGRGAGKQAFFKEIGIYVIVGIVLLGMANGTSLSALAGKIASISSQLTATFTGEISPDKELFATASNNPEYQNQAAAQTGISNVNKIFIDSQICTQFGVSDIKELDFNQFGPNGVVNAQNDLVYANGDNLAALCANNLGYYFWQADSGVTRPSSDRSKLPDVSENQSEKLTSIITYLQDCYNQAGNNPGLQTKIRTIILSLSNPNTNIMSGLLNMLILVMSFVLITMTLFNFAKEAAIAKLVMLMGVISLPVAGPLIISSNKKLIGYGKGLIGLIAYGFIKATLFSLVFDIILNTYDLIVNGTIISLIIGFIFLLIAYKFHGKLNDMLNQFVNNTHLIPNEYKQTLNSMRNSSVKALNNVANKKKKKFIGYDENGNAMYQETATLAGMAAGALAAGISNDKSVTREMSKLNAERRKAMITGQERLRDANAKATTNSLKDATANVKSIEDEVNSKANKYANDTYDTKSQTFNRENFNEHQSKLFDSMNDAQNNASSLQNDATYKDLINKRNNNQLSKEEEQKLNEYNSNIRKAQAEANDTKNKLIHDIQDEASKKAHREMKDELKKAYSEMKTAADEVSNQTAYTKKIGDNVVVQDNQANMESLLASKKLQDLENGMQSTKTKLNKEEIDAARFIDNHNREVNKAQVGSVVDRAKGSLHQDELNREARNIESQYNVSARTIQTNRAGMTKNTDNHSNAYEESLSRKQMSNEMTSVKDALEQGEAKAKNKVRRNIRRFIKR